MYEGDECDVYVCEDVNVCVLLFVLCFGGGVCVCVKWWMMVILLVVFMLVEDERYFSTRGRRVREFASLFDVMWWCEWIGCGENRDCIVDDVDIKC